MKRILNLTVIFLLTICLHPALAEIEVRMPAPAIKSDKSSKQTNMNAAGMNHKLGRGLANLTMGWMEIFKGMQEVDRNENGVAAVAWGPVYGLGNAISRTAAGAFETLTFPFPTTADKDYDPILEPEFVLERHSDTVLSDPVTR